MEDKINMAPVKQLIKSKSLMDEGSKYLFEATHYTDPILEKGLGSWVWDVDGNKYLDLNAGQFCLSFGHSYTPFIKMISQQLEKIYHTNTGTLSAEIFEGAKKLAEIAGGELNKTIFLSTGSEANECALRYAKFATGREGVISVDKGYHGLTLASQAATMGGTWVVPKVPGSISVPVPDYLHSEKHIGEDVFIEQCIDKLSETFKKYGNNAAAFIIEPVIGVGGMVQIPYSYIKKVRDLCDQYGVLLIFDECQCGFGRSGDWFVFQDLGIFPDILVTAKAMGLGFCVSAVTFSNTVAKRVKGRLVHFSSHQNDPLSAAIVSFAINEIKSKGLLSSNREKGKLLLKYLKEACAESENLCNPRGEGLMCAFDIDDSRVENFREYSTAFIKAMQDNGVLIQAIRQGRTFRIMPNYFISDDEMLYIKKAIINSIQGAI